MRRLGGVVRIAAGTVLARSPDESYPDIGTDVIDERLDHVGRVVDVIGPVERPYLVIAPRGVDPPVGLLNEPVYAR